MVPSLLSSIVRLHHCHFVLCNNDGLNLLFLEAAGISAVANVNTNGDTEQWEEASAHDHESVGIPPEVCLSIGLTVVGVAIRIER